MHVSPLRKSILALSACAALTPLWGSAQVREVVSKQVAVGRAEAALHLEFGDGGELSVVLDDGRALVDGASVGAYEPGDALDAAWRSLLGRAVALDDGPLAEMLTGWSAPEGLPAGLAGVAAAIDRALEGALAAAEPDPEPEVRVSGSESDEGALVRLLLRAGSQLGPLGRAVEGLGGDIRVHIDEDVVVASDEVVTGALVVVEGSARIDGVVEGDVIVVDGRVEVGDGGTIEGDVRLLDGRLSGDRERVRGAVVDLLDAERDRERELREQIRDEARNEVRRSVRRFSGRSAFSPLESVFSGLGGLIENLVAVLLLGVVGAGIVAFAGDNFENVARTARRTPGRAAMVGLSGTFLLFPVWILGAIALAVSIVGIPVLIAWLPLFPIAAAAAAVMGYLAVARNAGEWLADSGYPWTDWIRKSNPIHTMLGGLLGLSLAFMAADVVGIAPFLGFVSGLLAVAGLVVTFLAIQVGFGAVLLTRAGRRREYWPEYDAEAAWQAAMKHTADLDEKADDDAPEERDA